MWNRFSKKWKTARFCSRECLNEWQRNTPWEERMGKEKANEIRRNMSLRSAGDKNPSKDPKVAKKISESLKRYLAEYDRSGERNPFYGKHHTEELKKRHSENKKGKWAYNDEQYQKLCERTPRGEQHPNWKGGPIKYSYSYPSDFNKDLKERIKVAYAYKCVICQESGKKLSVHHIDYDKNNSDESNLIPLCNSCHGKTGCNRKSWIAFFKEIKGEHNG